MNIFLVHQDVNNCWDTYGSFVVIAKDENEARNTYPRKNIIWSEERQDWSGETYGSHCKDEWVKPDQTKVTYLGLADEVFKVSCVVSSSFRS